ncbi:MAG: glycoside hydrolase family protein [Lachnospiraceae bacterium]|nr:glycoside hydrolase family protein [Lachnospiraceae bacterium]
MGKDYEKYLEGQYRGNVVERYKQEKDDEQKAIKIVQEVKEQQEHIMEEETKRILEKENVTSTEIGKVTADYGMEDKYGEYLLNGAILHCNQASLEDFEIPGDKIVLDRKIIDDDDRIYNQLRVIENPMSANGLIYATVGDAIKYENVFPFYCNCKIPADRPEEIKKIKEDKNCSKYGVCRHLMSLNEEWENISLNGRSYLSKVDINMQGQYMGQGYLEYIRDQAFLQAVEGKPITETYFLKEKDGITMTSILFCKHGGIISAITSGQIYPRVSGVSIDLIELLKKYETGMDQYGNYLNEGEPALYQYHSPSDDINVLTIGWGHAVKSFDGGWFTFKNGTVMNLYNMGIYDKVDGVKIKQGTSITKAQAEEILNNDIEKRVTEINNALKTKGINEAIDQNFYDALFMLTYQMGTKYLTDNSDLSVFLEAENFFTRTDREIKEQFGEFTNHLEAGTMRRRADELDIIFDGTYDRDYDETRYGDIWRKKTYPNMTTPGY